MYIIRASWVCRCFSVKEKFWNTSHHGPPKIESKVIWCFRSCTFFIYLSSVHLQAVITQSWVLIKSQHIIIYCGIILKTALDVNTFVQHLCDILQLVKNNKVPETGSEQLIDRVQAVLYPAVGNSQPSRNE